MAHAPEELLALLAEAIRTVPMFDRFDDVTDDDLRWLARTHAILTASKNLKALTAYELARNSVGYSNFNKSKLMLALQDAYAHLELLIPLTLQGAFIPPGEAFNGYVALVRIVKSASKDLLLVDPYVDATLFTDIAPMLPDGVTLRCLTSKQGSGELIAASGRWISTGENIKRPVAVRIPPPKTLHDRHIIVDGQAVWTVSQSIKDIAARSAASVTQDRTDMAAVKVEFWEACWHSADPLPAAE